MSGSLELKQAYLISSFHVQVNFFLRETVVVAPNNAGINVFPLNGIMSNTAMKISIFANIFSRNGITINVVIANNVHA